MRRLVVPRTVLLGVLLLGVTFAGCATTASAPSPEERAAVVGVWEYRTSGSPYLGRGTIHFQVRNGRLQAMLRDTQQGRLRANVNQRGTRLELDLNQVRVSGRIEDDRFVGLFSRPMWDVSTSQEVHHRRQRTSNSGSIVARRVRSPEWMGSVPGLDCPSILVESKYRCDASSAP